MPGKTDYGDAPAGSARPHGQYAPGSKEMRAWDEGFLYRYGGTAAARPITDNPHPADTAKRIAWDDGWTVGDGNTEAVRYMPATTGAPPA